MYLVTCPKQVQDRGVAPRTAPNCFEERHTGVGIPKTFVFEGFDFFAIRDVYVSLGATPLNQSNLLFISSRP